MTINVIRQDGALNVVRSAQGPMGQSAYDIAVAGGYTGTFQQFTQLLLSGTRPYLAAFVQGVLVSSEVVAIVNIPVASTLSPASCIATTRVAATLTKVLTIMLGVVQIGTITFTSGQTTGVVAIPSPVLAAGSQLSIVGPASADVTLADIALTLVAGS